MTSELHKIYDDDTFLVSYPRSGNTWMRYLIAGIKYPERIWNLGNINEAIPDMYEVNVENYSCPRIIKSHEPYQEKYPRVIYMYRDGRDVSVSYYHLHHTAYNYQQSFSEFLTEMLSGKVGFGSWQDHVDSWIFRNHKIPLLAIQYELLCKDTFGILKDVAAFLGLDVDDNVIVSAITNSSIEKQKEDIKKFSPHYVKGFRGGVKWGPGKWKEVFSDELLKLFWDKAGPEMEKLGYYIYT